MPLSAEEREEHEAAEAVRQVEEMFRRESSGGGDGDAQGDDEAEEMRDRYRRGMQRFEREERWRRSPSIKWTDREDDVRGQQLRLGDENRGRQPRRLDDQDKAKDKRMPGHRSPAPLGFGVRASIDDNSDFSRLGLRSAFDRDVDMLGAGEPNPFLTTRSPFEVKGKGKMNPGNWDERPGKRMMDPLDDIYAAGSDEEDDGGDERTRKKLMRSMGGGKWKGG